LGILEALKLDIALWVALPKPTMVGSNILSFIKKGFSGELIEQESPL